MFPSKTGAGNVPAWIRVSVSCWASLSITLQSCCIVLIFVSPLPLCPFLPALVLASCFSKKRKLSCVNPLGFLPLLGLRAAAPLFRVMGVFPLSLFAWRRPGCSSLSSCVSSSSSLPAAPLSSPVFCSSWSHPSS